MSHSLASIPRPLRDRVRQLPEPQQAALAGHLSQNMRSVLSAFGPVAVAEVARDVEASRCDAAFRVYARAASDARYERDVAVRQAAIAKARDAYDQECHQARAAAAAVVGALRADLQAKIDSHRDGPVDEHRVARVARALAAGAQLGAGEIARALETIRVPAGEIRAAVDLVLAERRAANLGAPDEGVEALAKVRGALEPQELVVARQTLADLDNVRVGWAPDEPVPQIEVTR